MNEFNTLEKVKELFSNVNGIGNQNCFFIGFKDYQKNSGMVKGMEYPYTALLINQTENGLGYFHLDQEKISLTNDVSKLKVCPNTYTFVKNEDIVSITVKNWALINKKIKQVTIKLNNKKTHSLCVNVNEALIPYHFENFAGFVAKYSK